MQPSDSLTPIGLGSGRPLPSAYLVAGARSVPPGAAGCGCIPQTHSASEKGRRLSVGRFLHEEGEGLPGFWAVLFVRAVVEDPAGCGPLLAR